MAANQRNDQVFQLSLTEIAFTIAFILLLLLGHLVMRETTAKNKAEAALAQVGDLEAAQQALSNASDQLKSTLSRAGAANPDDVISKLVAEAHAAAERDRLLVRVKDLEGQISALAEVKKVLAEAGRQQVGERVVSAMVVQAEAERALEEARQALAAAGAPADPKGGASAPSDKKQPQPKSVDSKSSTPAIESTSPEVRRAIEVTGAVERTLKELGAKPLPRGKEAQTLAGMVRLAEGARALEASGKGVAGVIKENTDLRGQMANMRSRFNAIGKGLDHPPCWADEAGNIEYLFNVELRKGQVSVSRNWPERRNADAANLPGVAELLTAPVSLERFRALSGPILELGKRQDPECRHFVVLNNLIEGRREADQARWMVEEFFYKREARR